MNERVGRFRERAGLAFHETDGALRGRIGKASEDQAGHGILAHGKFRHDGDPHAGGDHCERGFELAAFEFQIEAVQVADGEGLSGEAVAIAQVDEGFRVQVGRARRRVGRGERVSRGDGEQQGFAEKPADVERPFFPVLRGDIAEDGELDGTVHEQLDEAAGFRFADLDIDFRIGITKGPEQAREQIGRDGGNHAEDDAAFVGVAALRETLAQDFRFVEDARGVLQQDLAGRGCLDAARLAVDEWFAEFLFQQAQLLAQRRLGDPAALGGTGQRTFFTMAMKYSSCRRSMRRFCHRIFRSQAFAAIAWPVAFAWLASRLSTKSYRKPSCPNPPK